MTSISDQRAAWRRLWRARPAAERWLLNLLSGVAVASVRLAHAVAWRAAAAVIGLAGMGWLLTDATRALMAETPAPAPQADAMLTGAIRTGSGPQMPPEWVAEQPRRTAFEFRLRDVQGQPVSHGVRRERHSGAREEVVAAGRFDVDGPWLVVVLSRAGEPPARLPVALARRAAEQGLTVARISGSGALASKFGPIEAADVTMMRGDGAGAPRACIAFRHAPDDVAFTLSGWFCGAAARPADRLTLSCLIERVGVAAIGDDAALRGHFAKAELNRAAACNPAHLQAAGRRTSWLDPSASAPPLRRSAI